MPSSEGRYSKILLLLKILLPLWNSCEYCYPLSFLLWG
jgi:hypothetical protein